LQSRIETIELVNQFKADQTAVQKEQMELLITLRNIREAMVNGSDGGSDVDSKVLKQLKEENTKLKITNEKQAYRINHLVTNMEHMMQK
jgi:hypothetical protein